MQLAEVVMRKTQTLEQEDLFLGKESSKDSSLCLVWDEVQGAEGEILAR